MEIKCIAATTQEQPETAAISFNVEPRVIALTYKGTINNEDIVRLGTQINHMVKQYQPEKIVLTLHSPGGEVTALHYWARYLEKCRERGIEIETRAATTCASAAAVMFALGAIGTRQALPLTTLLFHNPRVMAPAQPLLEHHLSYMFDMLEKSRKKVNQYLISHLTTSLGLMGFAQTLKKRAQCLTDPEFLKDCDYLSLFSAGAVFHLDELTPEFETWARWEIDDNDSANALINRWETTLKKMHELDSKIDLRCAWAMLLIDETDTLPPICIRDWRDIDPTPAHKPVDEPVNKPKP